jgi:Secretion system C-terminal sorting domain
MKKLYTLSFILFATLSFGQVVLNESFNYTAPGNIGGNLGVAIDVAGSNNWGTHSNTVGNVGTVDLATGSLTYAGLAPSNGNKILLPGSNATVPRDINREFTSASTTIYYSALINIVDNTQIDITSTGNYFMGLGTARTTTGTAPGSIGTLGARLGALKNAAGTSYRLSILNTSGGTTPASTEFAQDLNFGTTYLVVVKYDTSTAPTTASLWVNPASLGGAEPAATTTNTVGTGTFGAFGTFFLRNTAKTPKVEIDEIRVGGTWADVTPTTLATKQNTISGLKVYANNNNLFVTSDSNEAKSILVYNILGKNVIKTTVTNQAVNVADLSSGIYIVKVTENGKTNTVKVVLQ